jgi:pimeloyl-ACP methyl ester carboxylesterase
MKKVTSKDGTVIAYEQIGQGPVIVLVDGAFCNKTFGPMPTLAPLLAPHFTVISYDRRGRGDSTDTKPYAVEREIEDLQALLSATGGTASVFGMSSGAVLALHAAAKGLNIKKLAMYEPPFMIDEPAGSRRMNHEPELTRLINENRRSEAVKHYLVTIIGMPSFFYYVMRLLPMWSKMKAIANSLPYDAAIMGDFSLPAKIVKAVNVPSIAIVGEKSPALLQKSVKAVTDTLPNAKQALLKGQNHNVSTKVLAPVLIDFFKD